MPEPTFTDRLHALVEAACHGWRDSFPVERDGESMLVAQDRLTCHDLVRQADAILRQSRQSPSK
jgi:hypothetical protein